MQHRERELWLVSLCGAERGGHRHHPWHQDVLRSRSCDGRDESLHTLWNVPTSSCRVCSHLSHSLLFAGRESDRNRYSGSPAPRLHITRWKIKSAATAAVCSRGPPPHYVPCCRCPQR